MIVFYDKTGENIREIKMVEHNVITPTIPNVSLEEQIKHYSDEGLMFASITQEIGDVILKYNVCVNDDNVFVGLQPK